MTAVTDVKRPIESLSLPQVNQEIATRFAAANDLAQSGDYDKAKVLLDEVDQFEVRRGQLETFEQMQTRITEGIKSYGTPAEEHRHAAPREDRVIEQRAGQFVSPGRQFVSSPEYKAMSKDNRLMSEQYAAPEVAIALREHQLLEMRALIQGGSASSGGGFVTPDYRPGYTDLRQRQLTVLDLLTRIPTSSDTISYVRQDTFTNSAAFTAEATATTGTSGTKPESTLAFSRQTATVKTLAHWIPVTNRMLADAPLIQGVIDGQLLLGLDLVLESNVLTGDGTGENLLGITNLPTVLTQSMGSDSLLDAIFKAMVKVQVSGLVIPNATAMNPIQFQGIRLARENAATGTLGQYLMGPPSQIGATTLWGRPVVESLGLTAGTVIVGDWSSQCSNLVDREQSQIRTGWINDQLIRNMMTILAELRAAYVAWRPRGFCVITAAP